MLTVYKYFSNNEYVELLDRLTDFWVLKVQLIISEYKIKLQ